MSGTQPIVIGDEQRIAHAVADIQRFVLLHKPAQVLFVTRSSVEADAIARQLAADERQYVRFVWRTA